MDWFAIFKTGKHTDSKGRPFEATAETLDKIIEMNRDREVPIAIGHPATDSPAWGWVNELKRVGNILYAKPKSLVAEFEQWVQKKLYKERSVALNPDLTLRHIGFLGAMPPAVEGLPGVTFQTTEEDRLFEFSNFENQSDKEEQDMKKLFAMLGLTETATEDDAIAAVTAIKAEAGAIVANKAVLGALELKPEEATEAGVVGLINTFKKGHSDAVTLRADNARLEKEIADGRAEDAVHFARVKGKIKKEQETWALEYAKKDLKGFQEFVNKAAVVDEDVAQQGGPVFSVPGSDVSMDAVQDISRRALTFQAEQAKSGIILTISEAVSAVTKKKR